MESSPLIMGVYEGMALHRLRGTACIHQGCNHVWMACGGRRLMLDAGAAVDSAAVTDCVDLIRDGLRCGMPQLV